MDGTTGAVIVRGHDNRLKLEPGVGNSQDIGRSDIRWRDGHFNGKVYIGDSVQPYTNQTGTIGAAGKRFANAYFKGLNMSVTGAVFQMPYVTTTPSGSSTGWRFVYDRSTDRIYIYDQDRGAWGYIGVSF